MQLAAEIEHDYSFALDADQMLFVQSDLKIGRLQQAFGIYPFALAQDNPRREYIFSDLILHCGHSLLSNACSLDL